MTSFEFPSAVDDAREFLDFAQVLVVALDADGRIEFVNRETCSVLGYEEDELVGRDWFEACIPASVSDEVRATFDRVMSGAVEPDPAETYENPVLTKDGDERVVEWRNTPLRDDDGEIAGTLSSGRDVTRRKTQTRALSRNRRRYRTLVEQFPNGLVTLFDEDLRYRIVGGDGFDRVERSPSDLEGERLQNAFGPEHVSDLEPRYRRALAGEPSVTEQTLDGRIFRIRIVPVYDDGEVVAGMTMSQDVTEQRETERELEATKRRYRTLLAAAPNPIFVADAETGEIVEANEAAAELYGRPRAEIVGLHQSDLHPDDDAAAYRDVFERHVEHGGTMRQLPDGSQLYLDPADGERVPVEIDVSTVELDDTAVIYGIFRDITAQLAYERSLAGLNRAAQELFEARTTQAIDERIVETVTEVLDIPLVVAYRFDDVDGVLRPTECHAPGGVDGLPSDLGDVGPDGGPLWDAFVTGETSVENDVDTDGSLLDGETPIRSQLVVPIENHGVVAVGDVRPDRFDGRTVDLVEILMATAESALERTEREQELQRREHKLELRTRQLERAEAINTQIRSVARAIVDSETRSEIDEAVCSHLVEADPIAFAWIGGVDPVDEAVEPRACAGSNERYLEQFDGSLTDAETAEPAVRAVQNHERVIVSNTAREVTNAPWRRSALESGFQSAMSVPLLYRGSLQGVFTVYATASAAFDETLREVLSELGDLVAHALVSIDRKQALLSTQLIELEFDITDRSCFFLRFPRDVGCRIELEGTITQSDDSTLVFARVHDADPETLLDRAEQAPEVRNARLIESNEGSVIQIRFTSQFIGSYLAEHGITLRDITADGGGCRVTATIPTSYDVRRAVDAVTTRYADSTLRAKRDRTSDGTSRTFSRDVLDRLTPRQQEVLELAYHSGYFDSPKGSTGSDLSDVLDISSSAFHAHVRRAERKLLDATFDHADET